MAKKVTGTVRLQIQAGQANPAPPVGPALGSQGINIMAFCKEFNAATKDKAGLIIPVVITVYQDKSFTFILKSPPAAVLLKKECFGREGWFDARLEQSLDYIYWYQVMRHYRVGFVDAELATFRLRLRAAWRKRIAPSTFRRSRRSCISPSTSAMPRFCRS